MVDFQVLSSLYLQLGFEQNNKYIVQTPNGEPIAVFLEQTSFLSSISRQFLRKHRPFQISLLDLYGKPMMQVLLIYS